MEDEFECISIFFPESETWSRKRKCAFHRFAALRRQLPILTGVIILQLLMMRAVVTQINCRISKLIAVLNLLSLNTIYWSIGIHCNINKLQLISCCGAYLVRYHFHHCRRRQAEWAGSTKEGHKIAFCLSSSFRQAQGWTVWPGSWQIIDLIWYEN